MALSADSLTDLIVSHYRIQLASSKPVVKNVIVTSVPKVGGGMDYEMEKEIGPPEFDEDQFRPMAKAIALAIISHLKSSAEAEDLDSAKKWRIV